nr:replication protein [SPHINX/BMMF group 2 DNA sequence]
MLSQKRMIDRVRRRNQRPTRLERVAKADDVRGAQSAEGTQAIGVDTKRGRRKQHWQVPPVTRVRVKKRIKRWDGYLCVMHM